MKDFAHWTLDSQVETQFFVYMEAQFFEF